VFGFLKVIFSTPGSDRGKVRELLRIYSVLARETARIQKLTGLRCLPGCGECCNNPNVEVAVLELLPLAAELWRTGQARPVLERLSGEDFPPICIFYERHPESRRNGCCAVYTLRPLICRLFGFATVMDKNNQPELVTCAAIKQTQSPEYQKAGEMLRQGMTAPRMADYFRRIQMIDLAMTQYRLPINEALRLAIERVGFLKTVKPGISWHDFRCGFLRLFRRREKG